MKKTKKFNFVSAISLSLVFQIYISLFSNCSQNDERCLACDNKGSCMLCVQSYSKEDGTCEEPLNKIKNCLFYVKEDNEIKCKECELGYTFRNQKCEKENLSSCLSSVSLSADEIPEQISISNRLFQESNTTTSISHRESSICNICDNGILAHLGKCKSTRYCSIEHCKYCYKYKNENEKCILCNDKYTITKLWNGTNYCKLKTVKTKNCWYAKEMNEGEDECQICQINYFNKSGMCEESSKYLIDFYKMETITENLINIIVLNFIFIFIYF